MKEVKVKYSEYYKLTRSVILLKIIHIKIRVIKRINKINNQKNKIKIPI